MGFISYNDYTLNETYDSFVELQKLAHDVEDGYKNKNFKKNIIYPIKQFTKREYDTLKDFINANIGIIFTPGRLKSGDAIFVPTYQYFYNFKEPEDKIKLYPHGILRIGLLTPGILIHELQHAYDSIRSNGKFASSKHSQKYLKRESERIEKLIDKRDLSDSEYTCLAKSYFRTEHEMSAYFVKALDEMDFFYDKAKLNFKPFSVAYDDFKDIYTGYDLLEPKDKKRILRKFTQYYNRMKDRPYEDE